MHLGKNCSSPLECVLLMSATCSTVTDIKAVVTCWYVNTDDDTTVLFYSIYEQHASLLKQARLQISCLSAAAASLDTA